MVSRQVAYRLPLLVALAMFGCASPDEVGDPPPFELVALPRREKAKSEERAPEPSPSPVPSATTKSEAPAPSIPPQPAAPPPPPDKHVFVTSNRYGGDLVNAARSRGSSVAPVDGENAAAIASLVEATDFLCNLHAEAATLKGKYRAFIAIPPSDGGPAQRAVDRVPGKGPWKRMDGLVAFPSRASLLLGPVVPVSKTEYGLEIGDGQYVVWTGTNSDGSPGDRRRSCIGWSLGEGGALLPVRGAFGNAAYTGSGYAFVDYAPCDTQARLYCFEQ